MAQPLRSVEKPVRRRRRGKTIMQAADDGTRRELLVAVRARVAAAVQDPDTPARDLGTLTRRLMEIAREIDQIDSSDSQQRGYPGCGDTRRRLGCRGCLTSPATW